MLTVIQKRNATGFCHRCGQPCAPGELYGRECDRNLGLARIVMLSSGHTVAIHAAQAIGLGLLTPVRGHKGTFVYHRPEADRSATYLVSPDACWCIAFRHGQLCHHRFAATVLAA